jgi:hypothetical protein
MGHNQLCRPSDRLEGWVAALLLIFVLAALPAAGMVGNVVYEHESQAAAAQRATSRQVLATLRQNARFYATGYQGTRSATSLVEVSWPAVNGENRVGVVAVDDESRAGTTVSIWVDGKDQPTTAPANQPRIAATAVAAAICTLFGSVLAAIAAFCTTRWLLDLRRWKSWDIEWRYVGPRWTGRAV